LIATYPTLKERRLRKKEASDEGHR
jgi:hypothetical protein